MAHASYGNHSDQPSVPTEHPDLKTAERKPTGGEDRPGFDLGGAGDHGGQAAPDLPAAGPHAKADLINDDATPGPALSRMSVTGMRPIPRAAEEGTVTQDRKKDKAGEADISAPRLTPQGRTDPKDKGEDSTNPMGGGAKKGQGSKAEG